MERALDAHDRAGFLAHFGGPALRAATSWWDNLHAIGFDGGAVSSGTRTVRLNERGRGSMGAVLLGVNLPGDTGANTPATLYRWDVEWVEGTLRVRGWTSLGGAPWDCGCTLHVAKHEGAVVVSPPEDAELADELVGYLDAALAWTVRFEKTSGGDVPRLDAAVAFATSDPKTMGSWFRRDDEGDDKYWSDPPPAYTHFALGAHSSADTLAGGRLVLGPDILSHTTEILVHELMHYRLASVAANDVYLSENAYLIEGIAQLVQQIYTDTSDADAEAGDWVVGGPSSGRGITPEQVDKLFTGAPPTPDQLYRGPLADKTFWYQIAASVYGYLAQTYGLDIALRVAVSAHGGHSPFSMVPDSSGAGKLDRKAVQDAWAGWVRKNYG